MGRRSRYDGHCHVLRVLFVVRFLLLSLSPSSLLLLVVVVVVAAAAVVVVVVAKPSSTE